jgi:lycopene beta-cyclase
LSAPSEIQHYDYIFCGTGASASLLLLEMHSAGLLKNARVLLIDREKKNRWDKTFCFWSHNEEPIGKELNSIISHTWDTVILPKKQETALEPLRYNHVSSIDLYREIDRLREAYEWPQLIAAIDTLACDEQGPYLQLNGQTIRAKHIFDSRTPVHAELQPGETHIHQSFVGWMIETPVEMSRHHAFRFMDFEVEQSGYTQFVYVLPFSPTRALVEVTRFGADILQESDAELLLEEYIARNFGAYEQIGAEHGCIPMSNGRVESESIPGVVRLGAGNYSIKPSTGYAFKNMYYHAKAITEKLVKGEDLATLNKTHGEANQGRFSFYDGLLLDILKKQPQQGKPIFTSLFKNIGIQRVLDFLDEKTSIREDVTIFSKLPWQPFVAALFRKLSHSGIFRPMMLMLLALLVFLLDFHPELQSVVGYGLLLFGLVTIGIPHGAVDHLLESGKWEFRKAPAFIVKYLAWAAAMAVLWIVAPGVALVLFLLYSSLHFGQADGKLWQLNSITSPLWGASVLAYLLGTHASETNAILQSMGDLSLPYACPFWVLLPWLGYALVRKNFAFAITCGWLMLCSRLPLLFAFGLYFIGQHSLVSWSQIQQHLKMNHRSIWLHALPFHAGAWFILLLFYFWWPAMPQAIGTNLWGLFFIFIACISFPHVIAMQAVYKAK